MKNDKDLDKLSLVEWAEENKQLGTPTMVLMPAQHYCFKVHGKYKITIPRKGNYYDIDPEFFDKEDGEFNILDENNSALFLPSISKVLFAVKKYPKLAVNEFFAPIALGFNKDTVDIYGQIIKMLNIDELDNKDNSESDNGMY